jgi:DNA-directed RNA polymerase subunit K/omega
VILRPPDVGAFQFVVLATLRAAQLIRGCRPTVDGTHKPIVTAQIEVAEGKVTQLLDTPVVVAEPVRTSGKTIEDPPVIIQPA